MTSNHSIIAAFCQTDIDIYPIDIDTGHPESTLLHSPNTSTVEISMHDTGLTILAVYKDCRYALHAKRFQSCSYIDIEAK